jgi:hypothetical protein
MNKDRIALRRQGIQRFSVWQGGIAQKAWLPVLGAAESWTLQAAWSPGKEKALRQPPQCAILSPRLVPQMV